MADDSSFWDGVGDIAKAVLAVAVAYELQAGLNSLLQGKQKAQNAAFPQEDPLMPAIKFAGEYSRTSGAIVFREVETNVYTTISAVSLGRLDSFDEYWLATDKVGLTDLGSGTYNVSSVSSSGTDITDGRYIDDKCRWFFRFGAATETSYSDVTTRYGSSIWPSTARGDNIGSFCVERFAPDAKFMAQAWPGGPADASVSARGVCYDWRKDSTVSGGSGLHRRDDPTTWEWSANPVVWLVFKEWSEWGTDWDTEIAPVISNLTTAADYCEDAITLHAGGTEQRYRCSFNYLDDEDQDKTRQRLLDAMDGFYTRDGLGRLVIKPGKYEDPTFTITADDICAADGDSGYSWTRGTPNASAVDLINITFMSPENDYKDLQCDPWVISSGTRASSLDLGGENSGGVRSFTQARRLGKRKAARVMPTYRGWVRVGLMGRNGLGERYTRIQNPRLDSMANVVCEVTNVEFDPDTLTFVFTVISADTNIDSWNPATEEGSPITTVPGVASDALVVPTITSAMAQYVDFSDGSTGVAIAIEADSGTTRTDLTWYPSYKLSTDSTWVDLPAQGGNGDGTASLTIPGPVAVNATVNVRVEYTVSSGSPSGWSSTTNVDTSTSAIAPAIPTDAAASTGGSAGQIDLTWRNPSSSNFDHTVIRRSTASDMSGATTLSNQYGSAGAVRTLTDTGLTTGTTYYYDFAAANASGTLSARTAPVIASAA